MSVRSARLTVLVQPSVSLWPRNGHGEPGKLAPAKCQPSSLSTTSSYHAVPPQNGWWLLETSRVTPSPERLGATAKAFDPASAASSPKGNGPGFSVSNRSPPPSAYAGPASPLSTGPCSRRGGLPATSGPMTFS